MKVDGGVGLNLSTVGAQAAELEEMGYTGVMTAETAHDPFFPLLVAAQTTEKVQLMTSIAVAFARSPMTLANIGHDLTPIPRAALCWVSARRLNRMSPSGFPCHCPTQPRVCANTLWPCEPSGIAGMKISLWSLLASSILTP